MVCDIDKIILYRRLAVPEFEVQAPAAPNSANIVLGLVNIIGILAFAALAIYLNGCKDVIEEIIALQKNLSATSSEPPVELSAVNVTDNFIFTTFCAAADENTDGDMKRIYLYCVAAEFMGLAGVGLFNLIFDHNEAVRRHRVVLPFIQGHRASKPGTSSANKCQKEIDILITAAQPVVDFGVSLSALPGIVVPKLPRLARVACPALRFRMLRSSVQDIQGMRSGLLDLVGMIMLSVVLSQVSESTDDTKFLGGLMAFFQLYGVLVVLNQLTKQERMLRILQTVFPQVSGRQLSDFKEEFLDGGGNDSLVHSHLRHAPDGISDEQRFAYLLASVSDSVFPSTFSAETALLTLMFASLFQTQLEISGPITAFGVLLIGRMVNSRVMPQNRSTQGVCSSAELVTIFLNLMLLCTAIRAALLAEGYPSHPVLELGLGFCAVATNVAASIDKRAAALRRLNDPVRRAVEAELRAV